MADKNAEPLLPVELGAGKGQVRAGHEGRPLGVRDRR